MYNNTNEDLYSIPNNDDINNPSEGLYDAPCDLEEPIPVIQNKYAVQYNNELSNCATNESYAVVDRNSRNGNMNYDNKNNEIGDNEREQKHCDEEN